MAKKKVKSGSGWQLHLLLVMGLLSAVVFSAMAILLVVGMIPTIVAALADRTKYRLRTWTIGAMNLAGCVPFLLEIGKKGASIEIALEYISNPRTIVVMYFAAAMGYVIDWAVTSLVASFMIQRGKGRQTDIEKQQKLLVERWGPEVTGEVPLDESGFAKVENPEGGSESTASASIH
jgi:hypothetical protein